VFVARLICSDVECAVELSAEGLEVSELESLLCDCGCTLEIIGWPDWVDEPGQLIALRVEGVQLRPAA
jgi:hypothetical protein